MTSRGSKLPLTSRHLTRHQLLKFVLLITTCVIVLILHVFRRSGASTVFANNNIPTFECLINIDIVSYTFRLRLSTNLLINTIEICWLLNHIS